MRYNRCETIFCFLRAKCDRRDRLFVLFAEGARRAPSFLMERNEMR